MKKENKILILSIILLIVSGVLLSISKTNLNKEPIYLDDKMDECRNVGGRYSVFDLSLEADGSDYRAYCDIPEQTIFKIKLK